MGRYRVIAERFSTHTAIIEAANVMEAEEKYREGEYQVDLGEDCPPKAVEVLSVESDDVDDIN